MFVPVEWQMIADKTRHSVAYWTAAGNGIGWYNAYKRRFFEESNFKVELIRSVFGWHVTVTRPNDVTNVKSFWFFP